MCLPEVRAHSFPIFRNPRIRTCIRCNCIPPLRHWKVKKKDYSCRLKDDSSLFPLFPYINFYGHMHIPIFFPGTVSILTERSPIELIYWVYCLFYSVMTKKKKSQKNTTNKHVLLLRNNKWLIFWSWSLFYGYPNTHGISQRGKTTFVKSFSEILATYHCVIAVRKKIKKD